MSERDDTLFVGVPGSPGIAIGGAVVVQDSASFESIPDMDAENIDLELMLFDRAIRQVRNDIERVGKKLEPTLPREERAIFDAYMHMLDDVALADDIRLRIQGGQWAQGAL